MVNLKLLMELRNIMDKGAKIANLANILYTFEFFKQISNENPDLKEELEDMDIKVQIIITDINEQLWLIVKNGILDYGRGYIENPSFTMGCIKEIAAAMMFGEIDATSAYMAGDITVEGNLQDAMAYQEIIELALEAFEDLTLDKDSIEKESILKYAKTKDDIKIKDLQLEPKSFVGIEVENLLFKNHYKFNLITNKIPMTILHGLNGSGKTTFLRLIFYLLTGQYERVIRIKFSKISFKFENGTILSFERKRPQFLKSTLTLNNGKKFDFPLDKKHRKIRGLSRSDVRRIFLHNPNWESLVSDNDFPYMNLETKEIVSSPGAGYKYIREYPEIFSDLYSFSPIIETNLSRLSVYFIQTNRLESIESLIRIIKHREISRLSKHKEEYSYQIPLKIIKLDLKQKIQDINEKANTVSNKFDSEFFNLLLEQIKSGDDTQLTPSLINQLKEELKEIDNLEQELLDLGLYQTTTDAKKEPKRILREDQASISKLYDAIVVFNKGLSKKFDIYKNLKEKVKLFYDFVASHFRGKKLMISRQNGFQFITNDKIVIEPWELSSGEQHLILLSYFLIFLLKPNSLILIDEPEISLHLKWQRTFIDDILKLSKHLNPKFIIATHSPAIIGDYDDQMLKMHILED